MTEHDFGKGAVKIPRNELVASFGEIVADSPVFDWERGFDIRIKLGRDLSLKNQGISSSCGGQASAYLTEAILASAEQSARSIYNKCFYPPEGGSTEQGLMNTIINLGVDFESVTTSYENGNPPSEDFMRKSDGNPSAIKGMRPVYITLTFDQIASATLQNGGSVIGISGQNNGTWLSPDPVAPKIDPQNTSLWHHWVYVGFAGIRQGRRVLGFKNSWGNVGENGWQYIDESHLPYIFCAWSMIYQTDSKPHHTFNEPLVYGQSSKEVVALQDILRYEGLFNNPSTGYYGILTSGAVLAFQRKYAVAPNAELDSLHGKRVGVKTINQLNLLYAN